MKYLACMVFLLLLLPIGLAANTEDILSITLLSVSQQDNDTLIGGTAEMRLQLRPGNGAIFIESYPLSKLDTQVATRLANEIACEFTTANCDEYDFFYTLRANAPIIGGPSAGGATAVLTLAALEDLTLRDDIAMTGAISSGGIITPVGGVKEKVIAASLAGKKSVILPNLSFSENASDNATITHAELEEIPIEIFPVITLQEALSAAALMPFAFDKPTLVVDSSYQTQMKITSQLLCDRSADLQSQLSEQDFNHSLYTRITDLLNKSQLAHEAEDYYARASYCYSANINLRELLVMQLSQDVKLENKIRLATSIQSLETTIDNKPLLVFSDLETYFIVKERLAEAQLYVDEINETNVSSRLLSLAIERYYSGIAWSEFFDLPGEPLVIDQDALRLAALQEFDQVESRLNYLRLYLPEFFLEGTTEQLIQAKEYFSNEHYGLALFKATKTRASANAYLSTLSLTEENSALLVWAKLSRAEEVIASQQEFPILGYSYYEYATNLVESDTSTALLYSEYALAFSDLDTYFAPKERLVFSLPFTASHYYFFFTGLFLGLLILVIRESFIKRKKRK